MDDSNNHNNNNNNNNNKYVYSGWTINLVTINYLPRMPESKNSRMITRHYKLSCKRLKSWRQGNEERLAGSNILLYNLDPLYWRDCLKIFLFILGVYRVPFATLRVLYIIAIHKQISSVVEGKVIECFMCSDQSNISLLSLNVMPT